MIDKIEYWFKKNSLSLERKKIKIEDIINVKKKSQ